jgi:DNA primase
VAFGSVKAYLENLTPIIREAYVAHASTVLAVNPALFGGQSNLSNTKARFESTRDDIGQLSIIKTLIENDSLINKVSNVIEPSMFGNYATLLEAVIKGEENSNLTGLLLDESIKSMDEEELSRSLASFLFRYYSIQLKSITVDASLPLQKKSFLIRKIKMDVLPRLKRGELVTYKF